MEKKINIVINYDAMNSQSDELASQEISETIAGLMNSLRTQVNNVQVDVKFQNNNKENNNE
jgi:hypothetical protein